VVHLRPPLIVVSLVGRKKGRMSQGKPRAWRRRQPRSAGPELLARVATLAVLTGAALVLAVPHATLAAGMHVWKPPLVAGALALLASVLAFPDWWAWHGSWRPSNHVCGARRRRANRTVDLRKARSPHARPRPEAPGAHRRARPPLGGTLATSSRHTHGEHQQLTRLRGSVPGVQRHHGRPRG
jgi:hypothetical protein